MDRWIDAYIDSYIDGWIDKYRYAGLPSNVFRVGTLDASDCNDSPMVIGAAPSISTTVQYEAYQYAYLINERNATRYDRYLCKRDKYRTRMQ